MVFPVTVANAGPLIALANINCFHFLQSLFHEVHVPQAVYREATRLEDVPSSALVRNSDWIKQIAVKDLLAVELLRNELDAGESEAIVLARELNATRLLIDERLARRKTAQLELKATGTLGVLLLAKSLGITSSVKPHLDALRGSPFRMSPQLYDEILLRANET